MTRLLLLLILTATCHGNFIILSSHGCHAPGRYVVDACGTVSDTVWCSEQCNMDPVAIPDCGEYPRYRKVGE